MGAQQTAFESGASTTRPDFDGPLPRGLFGFVFAVSGWHQLWLAGLSVAVFVLSTIPIEIQRRVVDDALRKGMWDQIVKLVMLYLALALGEGIIKLGLNIYRAWVGEMATKWLRRRVEELLRRVPAGGLQAETAGLEISMLLEEADPIGGFIGLSVSEPLLQGGLLVSVFALMAWIQPWMAFITVALFVPQMVLVPIIQVKINKQATLRIRVLRDLSIAVVAQAGSVGGTGDRQVADIEAAFRINMRMFRLKFSMNFLMNLLHHFAVAAVLGVGGYMVVKGETEVGSIVAFLSGLAKINDPWGDLVDWFRQLRVTQAKYALLRDAITASEGQME
jgi:ABC-type multidrug transport system fused ATPase/permease subunit